MFYLLIFAILVLLVLIVIDRVLKNKQFEKIPGPPGIFFLENALDFLMEPVQLFYYLRGLAVKYKEMFKIKIGPKKFIVIYNPEDVEVLISGTKNNSKGFLYGFIEDWLNQGLLLSDGQKWHNRRKILTPAFHFNILRHFYAALEENSCNLADKLKPELEQPRTDMSSYITEFTLHSICETAMGTKLDEESTGFGKRYKDAIYEFGQYVVYRAQRIWMYPDIIYPYTSVGKKQKQVLELMTSFRDNVINKRRQSAGSNSLYMQVANNTDEDIYATKGRKRLAMLDLLLHAEKEGQIDVQGIGEEVDTFMFEGHDTTATALLMTFMLLANNQECQDKIVEECREIFGSEDRSPTINDLSKMKYLECCIKEGLRLYPPVHFITRKITQNLKLRGYDVPAGTDCTIFIYDLHRRSDQFVDPLEFKPERFQTDTPTWHPYSYIPFSAGPRNCIGQKFAMMEMKLAISAVLRRYKILPVTRTEDIIFITDFILRTNHPIYVKFERRNY